MLFGSPRSTAAATTHWPAAGVEQPFNDIVYWIIGSNVFGGQVEPYAIALSSRRIAKLPELLRSTFLREQWGDDMGQLGGALSPTPLPPSLKGLS